MKMEEFAAKENENPCDLETDIAERSMWLMKCPSLAASSLKSLPFADDPYLPVAKIILSIDPLASVDDGTKVVMELTRAEFGNIPKRYVLDMSKDFIPMSVFCESSSHGKLLVQGKINNDVCDVRLHNENIESYGTDCGLMQQFMKDLCIYNNKGSNQGTYELKAEYKKVTHE